MKTVLIGLGLAMVAATGCAHGNMNVAGTVEGRDVRGSAQVGQQARVLVVGPAHLVHASGEKPVHWFVAQKSTGGDADCAAARGTTTALPESTRAHLAIDAGQVLCAAVAAGATDVSWHQFNNDGGDSLWARR
jgi:hypothetical protein